jgi:hypothetical protein
MRHVRPLWLWSSDARLFLCRLGGRLLQPLAVAVQRETLVRAITTVERGMATVKEAQAQAAAERERAERDWNRASQAAEAATVAVEASSRTSREAEAATNLAQAGLREVPIGEYELLEQRHAIFAHQKIALESALREEESLSERKREADAELRRVCASCDHARTAEAQAARAVAAKSEELVAARARHDEWVDMMEKLKALDPRPARHADGHGRLACL